VLNKKRTEALLASLAPVIGGRVSDGYLRGSYRGFAVEAQGLTERPSHPRFQANNPEGATPEGPRVNIFRIKLAGASGGQFWDCRSSPTMLSKAVPEVFTSLTYRLMRTEFAFERPTGGRLSRQFGVPPADETVQERLRAGGLLDELESLRWGRHPYLPQVRFNPGLQATGADDLVSGMKERLRTVGRQELESALDGDLASGQPGELLVQVEMERAKVPTEDQFRELLERVIRIEQINAEANPR
jgi:hypothetical protein